MKQTRKNLLAPALAAFLTLFPNAPLLMEAAAQLRPIAVAGGQSGPVFVPGSSFSPGVQAGGISAPVSSLGAASLPQGVSLTRYQASVAPHGSRVLLPSGDGASLAAVSAASKASLALPVAAPDLAVSAKGPASREESRALARSKAAIAAPASEARGPAAIDTLKLGERISADALRPQAAAEESSAVVSRQFDASRLEDPAAPVPGLGSAEAARRTASLEKGDARPADEPAADIPAPNAEDGAPRRSISRAVKYGLMTGALMLAFNSGVGWAAQALGYVPHSNYDAPGLPQAADLADAGSLFFMGAVMAPIVEEIVFRAGLLSGIEWLTRKAVRRGAGVIASVAASAVFVVLHETADPFLIAVRMAGALLMAYTYKREGLMASIVLHAVNNGVLIGGMILSALLPSGLAMAAGAGSLLLGAGAALWAARGVFGQRADRREGRIGRYELTPKSALVLAALLGLGALLLSPKLILVNLPFVAGLGFYAWRKRAKA